MAKTKIKNYQVIWERPINVHDIARNVGDIFEHEETQEIKNLVREGYLKVV